MDLIDDLRAFLKGTQFDHVAGIDALGFVLGTALAVKCGKGFIPIRKIGKLPVKTHAVTFVDYTGIKKGLELAKNSVKKGAKIVLVDDWIETGAQVKAAIRLLEGQGARIAAVGAISIDRNPRTDLILKDYPTISLFNEGADRE